MEWKHYKMEELIEEISMGPFGSDVKKECYVESGIPILNGSNLQGFKLHEESFGYLTEEKADSLKKSNAHRGDIIVTHRGTLGQIVYIPEDSKYERYVISQSQFRFRCKKDLVDVPYLVYFFHTALGQHKILANASQVGVPALARASTTFRQIEIDLPSLSTQHRIASILSSLDSKIELNNKINAQLEEMAQALFKSWFVDFEPFKDGKFVESELGMIPEGWRVGKFTEIMDLCPGGTPKTSVEDFWENGDIPFFSPKDVTGSYCFDTEKHITSKGLDNCSSRLYQKNTVFITCRGTVGKVTLAAVPMAMNQSNYAILAKEGYSQFFSFFLTKSIVEKLQKKANGAVFSAITTKDFDEEIVIPPKEEIVKFNLIAKQIFDKILCIGFESSHLSQLRDTLLPKLMNGEIEL